MRARLKSLTPAGIADRVTLRQAITAAGGIGGYEGARRKRALQEWIVSSGSASADLLPDLQTLRERSRDLERNAPLARGAIATLVTNTVGTGLVCQPRIDREYLGLSDEVADGWERQAERIFLRWSESAECDQGSTLTFGELQDVAMRGALVSGDCFAVKRFVSEPGRTLGFALQLLEADRVDTPTSSRSNPSFQAGVELGTNGAPLAYHVADRHPGDVRPGLVTWTRVPAYVDGRRMVLHVFRPERPEQPRGVPYLASVIEPLKQLDRYAQAEVMAAVVSAMLTVFVRSEADDALGPTGAAGDGPDKTPDLKLAPGAIIDLAPGESIDTVNPGRPNPAFDGFTMAVLRQVGTALELPYEILIKHFTASYSAARAALLEAWKTYRTRRTWLARRLCQPAYEEVIAEAVARGMLAAPGFLADAQIRAAYVAADWIGPAMGQIDPGKEADAAETMVAHGWKTEAQVTAELTGGDWERNIRQRGREQRARTSAGVADAPPSSVPAVPVPSVDLDDAKDAA